LNEKYAQILCEICKIIGPQEILTESLFSRAAAYDTPDSKGRQGSETILDLSDTSQSGDVRTQPRAQGSLRIACKPLGAQTVLSSLYQKGSLKALFPRAAGSHMDAVFLNTAGGITGGDAYTYSLNVSEGASLRMTSQAAERVYKATLGHGRDGETRLHCRSMADKARW